MKKKYPFEIYSAEELAEAVNQALDDLETGSIREMTEEEIIEEDAEYGYFQQEEDDE